MSTTKRIFRYESVIVIVALQLFSAFDFRGPSFALADLFVVPFNPLRAYDARHVHVFACGP
jgi:hypothetical protein